MSYQEYRDADAYLKRKGIHLGMDRGLSLEEWDKPNTFYASRDLRVGAIADDHSLLDTLRQEGKILAEVPFANDGEFNDALIKLADAVKTIEGQVTLADPVHIPYADKGELRKLKTRISKSTTPQELAARGKEAEQLTSLYEERENDTERDDLVDKYQAISSDLEAVQHDLESGNSEAAIWSLDDALVQ